MQDLDAASSVVDSEQATNATVAKRAARALKAKTETVLSDDEVDKPDDDEALAKAKPSQKKAPRSKAAKAKMSDDADGVIDDANVTAVNKPSRDIHVPVDEGCPLAMHRVYIDPSGVIYDGSLNQTNASNNNNKFYRIQVRSRGYVLEASHADVSAL